MFCFITIAQKMCFHYKKKRNHQVKQNFNLWKKWSPSHPPGKCNSIFLILFQKSFVFLKCVCYKKTQVTGMIPRYFKTTKKNLIFLSLSIFSHNIINLFIGTSKRLHDILYSVLSPNSYTQYRHYNLPFEGIKSKELQQFIQENIYGKCVLKFITLCVFTKALFII